MGRSRVWYDHNWKCFLPKVAVYTDDVRTYLENPYNMVVDKFTNMETLSRLARGSWIGSLARS